MRHAETSVLGAGGPVVTRLGLGGSAIGGLFAPVTDTEALAVVRTALDLGIRYVDTAPLYGLGASERRVGEALAGRPRNTFTLSTKVGRLLREHAVAPEKLPDGMWHVPEGLKPVLDFGRDATRRALMESLERLGLERVDIAYVHDPDDHLDLAIAEALPALAELRGQGLVGAIGAGMTDATALARIVREFGPDCVLLAGRYTLLDQSALHELLPLCEREGVPVVVGGVSTAASSRIRFRGRASTTWRRPRRCLTARVVRPRSARRTTCRCRPPHCSSPWRTRPSSRCLRACVRWWSLSPTSTTSIASCRHSCGTTWSPQGSFPTLRPSRLLRVPRHERPGQHPPRAGVPSPRSYSRTMSSPRPRRRARAPEPTKASRWPPRRTGP